MMNIHGVYDILPNMRTTLTKFGFGKRSVVIAVIIVLVIGAAIYFFWFRNSDGNYQLVTVTNGSITQVVSVTGNTTPIQSLDLSFPTGGTIEAVYKNAGDTVRAGDVLEELDTSGLQAQLSQAQAQVQAAQATLEGLQAGPTSQTVQVAQAAVATSQQALANTYTSIPNAVTDAYAKANDAVHNQVETFYNNPDSNNPQLVFSLNDPQVSNDANTQRVKVGNELNEWQTEIDALTATTMPLSTSTLDQDLQNAAAHLSVVTTMLNTDATAVVDATGLSADTAAAYRDDVASAITEVSSAASAINTIQQNIASEQASVAQAQAQLAQTLADPLRRRSRRNRRRLPRHKPTCKASTCRSRMRRSLPLSTVSLPRKMQRWDRSRRRGRS